MGVSIVYETHALTVDNETGHATGWLPGDLSAAGRRGAAELGERRRDDGIAVVYASDLARAARTAEIAFRGQAIPLRLDPRLRECDYGDLNGAPIERIGPHRREHIYAPWPGGQCYRDVVDQTADLLRELTRGWDGRRVLLIAHSANRLALDHLLRGRPLADLLDAPFDWRPGWEYRTG
jgi:broad specificity phosphatase PhoE